MAQARTFDTTVAMSISDGGEQEFILRLRYNFVRGYADTHDEPGCADTVEIVGIRLLRPDEAKEFDVPTWMQALIDADESLAASLIAHARETDAAAAEEAAERRAEDARHDRMMEGR
ncbi:hypothetical protein ACFQE0_13985 [Methylobacterium komagatae]|uniref:Uncharacterized protein n=1 Tax=Methylobacterium komagatae TaxID=374425 RepID=A0ABW2BLZ6_9HYPH